MHQIRSIGALLIVFLIAGVFGQFDRTECGISKGCHIPDEGSCPESCRGMGMSWRLIDDETLELELFTNSNTSTGRYVAVGFSDDEKMGNEPVIECSSLGDEPASMKFSYDKPRGKGNLRVEGDFSSHFFDSTTSFENGLFYCKSKIKIGGNAANERVFKYETDKKYHLLLVNGMTKPTGLIHHHPNQNSATKKISLRDIGAEEVNLSTCGTDKGCVTPIGEACYGMGEGMGATYKVVTDDTIEFEIFGPVNTSIANNVYVALGFSNDTLMKEISVLECSQLPNEKSPSLKFSYNPGNLNARIDGEPEIRDKYIEMKTAKIENGMIYCNGIVKVSGVPANPQIFKWDKNRAYHLLFATGFTDENGLTHHHGDCASSSRVFLDQKLHFDVDECGVTKACFTPTDCNDGGCDEMKASWRIVGPKLLEIELEAMTNGSMNRYIAMGFSTNSKMANASVIDCSSFNNAPFEMSYSFNTNSPKYNNLRSTSSDAASSQFSERVVQNSENRLYCRSKVKVDGSANDPSVFNYEEKQKYSIILATGPTSGNSLRYHNKRSVDVSRRLDQLSPNSETTTTAAAAATTDFPEQNDEFDEKTCGKEKGCFMPTSNIVASYKIIDDNKVEIEISATHSSDTGVYAAVGFSKTEAMGPAQVVECSSLAGKPLSMKLSYNENRDNVRIDNEQNLRAQYITNTRASFTNGKTYCRGTIETSGASNDEIFKYDPNQQYYLLLAKGDTNGQGLSYHGQSDRHVSSSPRKLDDYNVASGSSRTVTMLILHAVFMTIAWLILVPTAVIFARILRSSWPTRKPFGLLIWFHVHRTFNVLGILMMIAAFVFILIHKKWKFETDGWGGKHAIIGLVSLILAWLQPFISSLRCSPNDPRRPYFNYVHRAVGVAAMLLATTAICIAGYHFTPTRNVVQLVLAIVPVAVLLAVSVFFSIFDAVVKVDMFSYANNNKTQRSVVEDVPMQPSSKSETETTWTIKSPPQSTKSERESDRDEEQEEKERASRRSKINKFREIIVYISVAVFIAVGTILAAFFGTSFS